MGNQNSGRRPNSYEKELRDKLKLLEPEVFHALEYGINQKHFRCIQLWFQYMYGKPRDFKDIKIDGSPNIEIPTIYFKKTTEE